MKETTKFFVAIIIMGIGLLVGCEDDDTPIGPGNKTLTVYNKTDFSIQVQYNTQTWDLMLPGDQYHSKKTDIGSKTEKELYIHFGNKLGTSQLKVTKNETIKEFNVDFYRSELSISAEDFENN